MMSILEAKGLAVRDGANRYRGNLRLTEEGKAVAQDISQRAQRAVELAGKDLTEETRAIFYGALDSITENLRRISQEGL